jgi:hypothetical protein
MNLFHEFRQSGQIQRAQDDAAAAKSRAAQVGTRVEDLERRADRLALACQALWEILRTNLGMSDEQIREKMGEIDLRDGVADGRITAQVTNCTQCGRPVRSSRDTCLYCGHAMPAQQIVR